MKAKFPNFRFLKELHISYHYETFHNGKNF